MEKKSASQSASPGFLIGLFVITVLALFNSAVLGQGTTQISGTFAPSGNYSVDGNLFLMPLTTMQCNVAPQQSDRVEVSGAARLDGRLQVTMTGRFTRDGPTRYTLLQARGGLMGVFSLVSIQWVVDQGLGARITYDPNHVYLEIAFEPGEFPPPLDTQRPHEIIPAPATVSGAERADKPTSIAEMGFRPTVAGLTFTQRVAYQRTIEQVYWRHRIWPKDNPRSKPPLEAVLSERALEQKVEDYLRKSQFVADQRGRPISASELQAEMDRMAQQTRRPEMLRELFVALGNDPFVVAECLARPVVAERLLAGPTLVAAPKAFRAASTDDQLRARTNLDNPSYRLPEIAVTADCSDDTWTATSTLNAPDPRNGHTALWTGSEMIIWGGSFTDNSGWHFFNSGGRYDPATDTWTATSTINAPIARWLHTAVWTGSEMIVWAGGDNTDFLNTGGRYNPTSDSWTAVSTTNAPTARVHHTAVWNGSEMIVWGGYNYTNGRFNSGGRYNPGTDSWIATSTTDAPEARWAHTAEWTGSEMIVWGGTNQTIYLNTGGRYDPETDSWTATGVPTDVLGRAAHSAVWTGSEMIVWGGGDSTFNDCNTGGRYDPTSDSWTATSTASAPSPREQHTAVWMGSEMIVWGGIFCFPCIDFDTGGRYNPATDSWVPTSTANAPFGREDHTAVWTGSQMIVWGGYNYTHDLFLNTGGRYCAQSGPTPTPTPTPTATATASATPTPGQILLRAKKKRIEGINTVRLQWRGATSANIDVYRNNVLIVTTPNDGQYDDSTGDTGRARYVYRVCEAGTQTCSNDVTVHFPP
jgi:N-acetylneuraminic acid mutarotase